MVTHILRVVPSLFFLLQSSSVGRIVLPCSCAIKTKFRILLQFSKRIVCLHSIRTGEFCYGYATSILIIAAQITTTLCSSTIVTCTSSFQPKVIVRRSFSYNKLSKAETLTSPTFRLSSSQMFFDGNIYLLNFVLLIQCYITFPLTVATSFLTTLSFSFYQKSCYPTTSRPCCYRARNP